MNRLRSEARLSRCRRHQLRGFRHIQIDQLPALIADRVIVAFHYAVVTAGAVAKANFVNEPGFFQVAQRVVDGCVADSGQALACRLENVGGGGVIVSFSDHLEDCFALWCKLWPFQDGFRLILNPENVKRGQSEGFCRAKSTILST